MFEDSSIWTWTFYVGEWVIRVIMILVVTMQRRPEAARGWLVLIMFELLAGVGLYLLFGAHRLPRWRQEMLARQPDAFADVRNRLDFHPDVTRPDLPAELQLSVKLAEGLGHLPILGSNAAELLGDYGGIIDRLVADIDAAQNHVHLLYYIFADDRIAGRVIDALMRAAQRGVRCRVLVDSLGSRRYLGALYARLPTAGVHLEESLPVGFWRLLRWRTARVDLRNHRKITVIDGRVGYTGSQNIVDSRCSADLTYDEMVVRVTGPIVLELQYVFATDWFVETEEVLDGPDIYPDPEHSGQAMAQALPSGPGLPTDTNQRLFVSLIHGAREKVVITTPYFVPDEPIVQAMQTAVLRGAEVHLIVSERADQLVVSLAQRSYYEEMLDLGIRIHLYRGHFLHAKHLSIDNEIALIGSSNMDIRSFQLNNEISLIFYGADVAARLHREEARYLDKCRELRAQHWAQRRYLSKLGEQLARLLSPLL